MQRTNKVLCLVQFSVCGCCHCYQPRSSLTLAAHRHLWHRDCYPPQPRVGSKAQTSTGISHEGQREWYWGAMQWQFRLVAALNMAIWSIFTMPTSIGAQGSTADHYNMHCPSSLSTPIVVNGWRWTLEYVTMADACCNGSHHEWIDTKKLTLSNTHNKNYF